MKVSFIIPCFNEQEHITQTTNYITDLIKTLGLDAEIIIVNDGSNDNTETVIKNLKNPYIKYIALDKNRGKGASIKEGCKHASGDILIFTDADLPYDISHLKDILKMFDNKEVCIIIGDRTLKTSKTILGYGWLRTFSGKTFSFLIKLLLSLPYPDTQCGLKIVRKQTIDSALKNLIINSYTFDVELLYFLYSHNIPAIRIPVTFTHSNKSSINLFYDSLIMFFDLLRIRKSIKSSLTTNVR